MKFVKLDPIEESRTYHYPSGNSYSFSKVSCIAISKATGNHRIETQGSDKKAIMAPGWECIEIETKKWTF